MSLCLFLSSLPLFHERNNIKTLDYKVFLINPFSVFGSLSCVLFEIPFSYLCFSLDFKLCFCSTSMFLVSKTQVEKHQFWVKRGGCNKTFF